MRRKGYLQLTVIKGMKAGVGKRRSDLVAGEVKS
jgi:hypothetical protein